MFNDEKFADQDEKIKMLIDLHVLTEERFVRLAESQASLAVSQADTDRRLNSLIDIVSQGPSRRLAAKFIGRC